MSPAGGVLRTRKPDCVFARPERRMMVRLRKKQLRAVHANGKIAGEMAVERLDDPA
jgi:hypothetical protein